MKFRWLVLIVVFLLLSLWSVAVLFILAIRRSAAVW